MRLLPDAMPLSGRELRDSILSVLAVQWPLSAREVYTHVTKSHKITITYQGVHKTLKQMVSEGVLLIEGGKYLVNVQWARQMADFGNKLAAAYRRLLQRRRDLALQTPAGKRHDGGSNFWE